MKKKIFVILFVGLVLSVLLFPSCSTTTESSSYTAEITDADGTFTYVLTIDEGSKTFSMARDSSPELRYSGTFSDVNGYLILQSNEKGAEYVRIVGDTFSFFTPSDVPTTCEHVFELTESTPGTCSSKGYKKYVCTKCHYVKTEPNLEFGDHHYVLSEYKKGTCQDKECYKYTCSYCGDERIAWGEPGDHDWQQNVEVDLGCDSLVTIKRRCKTCDKIEVVETTDRYGSHIYDEGSDVCKICHYNKMGLCFETVDNNEDGVCDLSGMKINVLNDIKENGYSLSEDGTLYFGAYPTDKSIYSVETIKKNGKYDETTGYYRYNNASYLIKSKNNSLEEAFLITYLTWSKIDEGDGFSTYICNQILAIRSYLDGTKISGTSHASNPEISANNWLFSDLYAFANGEFFITAFGEKELELFYGSPSVSLPLSSLSSDFYAKQYTDFARFNTSYSSGEYYFSQNAGATDKEIACLPNYESGSITSKSVTSGCGFVPVITLCLE